MRRNKDFGESLPTKAGKKANMQTMNVLVSGAYQTKMRLAILNTQLKTDC